MCEKIKKKAESISVKENQDGKNVVSKFKDNGIMNTTLKSNNYLKLLKEWDDDNEKIYGVSCIGDCIFNLFSLYFKSSK